MRDERGKEKERNDKKKKECALMKQEAVAGDLSDHPPPL